MYSKKSILGFAALLLLLACSRAEDTLPPASGPQETTWQVDSVGTVSYALCANTRLLFLAPNDSNVQSRLWLPSGASAEQFTVTDTGRYTLTTTFVGGRVRIDTFKVYAETGAIAFPTGFVPAGSDDRNRVFRPDGSCIDYVLLRIFSMDGGVSKVVELSGATVAWDGNNSAGKAMPAGPYAYTYTARFRDGSITSGDGVVQLVR